MLMEQKYYCEGNVINEEAKLETHLFHNKLNYLEKTRIIYFLNQK